MSQPLSSGSRLKDRYRIERELGRGGIGVVYLARDERLHGMPVVIKFLLDASGQNAWLMKKFMQEAEALTRINHPGVVRVIDRDAAEDGRPFFVMEFIEGQSLRQVMRPGGMDLSYVARLVRQIGHALHAAHRQGVFHRDLKPENIMLQRLGGSEEQVKLIDFGIAKVLDSQAGIETEVAVFAGSQAYIAPEQIMSQPISAATDIYAFAIIIYEMLTGRRPFTIAEPNYFLAMQQLQKLQQAQSIVKPNSYRTDLPEAAQMLLLNALSYDVNRRPQNAQIFADDLARALAGEIKLDASSAFTEVLAPETQHTELVTDPIPIPVKSTAANSPVNTRESRPDAREKSNKAMITGLAAFSLFIVGAAAWILWSSGTLKPTKPPVATPTPIAPERVLSYSITLRRDSRRYPNDKPFQVPGEMVFSSGDHVRFTFSSPQSGHLYIINESPAASGTQSSYVILFPSPTANQGSSEINADQQIKIPEIGEGIVFDEPSDAEKLWLVWSANPIDDLEALRRWANPEDKGEIKDDSQIKKLRGFLVTDLTSAITVERDDERKRTTLKGPGDTLIRMIKLEHR